MQQASEQIHQVFRNRRVISYFLEAKGVTVSKILSDQ
jgi:hypothetical protein